MGGHHNLRHVLHHPKLSHHLHNDNLTMPRTRDLHQTSLTTLPRKTAAQPLSHHARAKVAFTVRHAWKSNTLSKYESGVRNFTAFCNREGISNRFRLPASEHLLCAFAASQAGKRSGKTIRSDLSAIRAWHIVNDAPYTTGLQLQYTVKGALNMTPETSK
jgi:hypothetical protein